MGILTEQMTTGRSSKRRRFEETPTSDPDEDSSVSDKDPFISDSDEAEAVQKQLNPGDSAAPQSDSDNADAYRDTTDPKLVTGPVLNEVTPALKDAWAINKKNKMALIFDLISPVRQFKRDALYDEEKEDPYVDYDPNPEEDENVTETDEDGDLQPYNPIHHRQVQ